MPSSSLRTVRPITIPEFSPILHNEWSHTSFIGHDGEKFIEIKNCPFSPKLFNRLFISQEKTTRAIDKILDVFYANNHQHAPGRLRPFHDLWQNNWGLFTKAEFQDFCQQHQITVPQPY